MLARGAVVVVLAAGWTVFRLVVADPGPGYIVPVGLAAWWFGPIVGGLSGAGATVLYTATRLLDDATASGLAVPVGLRVVIYVGGGIALGLLAERSRNEAAEHLRHLAELRAIQEALTPAKPGKIANIQFAVAYLPAVQGVSGDFYVITNGPAGRSIAVVGDVLGKGLGASQLAWYVRTAIASAAQFTAEPAEILRLANATIFERDLADSAFVTLAVVAFDPAGQTLSWALAGHPPPILLDTGIPLDLEGAAGFPLGVAPDAAYHSATRTLAPDAGVLLFTDGLTEARHPTNGLLGERKIAEIVATLVGAAPDVLVAALRDEAVRHSHGHLRDDLCLVAIRTVAPEPTRQG